MKVSDEKERERAGRPIMIPRSFFPTLKLLSLFSFIFWAGLEIC